MAFRATLERLHGAYALGILHIEHPESLLCARMGSPLVVGGSEEHFIASDPLRCCRPPTASSTWEGDHALNTRDACRIFGVSGAEVSRPVIRFEHGDQVAEKGDYCHFMLKEIHEQPQVLKATLADKVSDEGHLLPSVLGPEAETLLDQVEQIQIVSCGTSYHAGLVA